jgi:hypothetical protein
MLLPTTSSHLSTLNQPQSLASIHQLDNSVGVTVLLVGSLFAFCNSLNTCMCTSGHPLMAYSKTCHPESVHSV